VYHRSAISAAGHDIVVHKLDSFLDKGEATEERGPESISAERAKRVAHVIDVNVSPGVRVGLVTAKGYKRNT
jgi:hypothetical protein